jgi:GntR family transcriptional repressor for pyruvate dehydrogenase complex
MSDSTSRIEPIKKSRLSEEVLRRLKAMIIDGTFKPGDQLPSERELSEMFQVSRASIREALRILETLGFLEAKVGVGGGTFVKEVSIDALVNPFSELLGSEKELIMEMLDFRRVLETEIARSAAEQRTDDDLRHIEETIEQMRKNITSGGIGVEGDTAFHDAVAEASGNRVFRKMLSMAKSLLVQTRRTTLEIPGQPEKSVIDHREIFEAIRAGDGDLAAARMNEHLVKARRNAERREADSSS